MNPKSSPSDAGRAFFAYLDLSLQHRPAITELSFGSRWGKTYAQFSPVADLGIMLLVQRVVKDSFAGEAWRVNYGIATFARRIAIGDVQSLLLLADAEQGTVLLNTSWLPGFMSRDSLAANHLVREIAIAAQTLSQSEDGPYFGTAGSSSNPP